MAGQFQKILIDSCGEVYEPEWRLDAENLGQKQQPSHMWSLEKDVLVGGRQHGVDVLSVDNGSLSFDIIPTRGMGIQEALYDGVRLGWDSPVGEIVHPQHVKLEDLNGLGWLNGFSEWMVRCGMSNNGAPGVDRDGFLKTLHGGVANSPASALAVSAETEAPYTIRVHGVVFEERMFGPSLRLDTVISTEPGANWLRIEDRVTNCRGVRDIMQMLYHVNYGPPVLEPGGRLLLPADLVVPRDPVPAADVRRWDRFEAPKPGCEEVVFYAVPRADRKGRTLQALRNEAGDLAVSHGYARKSLPCFTLWKNEAAYEDGFVTGLEPATNYPNHIAFERKHGRVQRLAKGKSWSTDITIAVHVGKKEVRDIGKRIQRLQGRRKPEVLKAPVPKFSACG